MLIWKQEFGKEKPVGMAQWDRDRDRREQGLGNARKQILWQRRGLGFQSTRMSIQRSSFCPLGKDWGFFLVPDSWARGPLIRALPLSSTDPS